MPQYFCGVDCKVYIAFKTSNVGSILVDNAHTIMYRQESNKHPLYGFRDTKFAHVAKGRTIVRGMLVLNREFKNELSYALINHPIKEQPPLNKRERPMGRYFPMTAISGIVDDALTIATSAQSSLDLLRETAERVRTAAVVAQVSGLNRIPQTSSVSELKEWIADTCATLTAQMGTINSQTPAQAQGTALLKQIIASSVDPSSEAFIKDLKQTYWGATTESKLGSTMPSPDSDDIFDALENDREGPRHINLEIKFGNPDSNQASQYADHSEIIERVCFEGSYSQVSIEDRNINQIHYPFVGRCLKGSYVPV